MPVALIVIAAVVLGMVVIGWTFRRSHRILDDWAAANGFTLLEVERRFLRRGPFFLRAAEGHEVFYVVARDPSGRTRRGFVRVGGWFLGLLSDKVVAQWDE